MSGISELGPIVRAAGGGYPPGGGGPPGGGYPPGGGGPPGGGYPPGGGGYPPGGGGYPPGGGGPPGGGYPPGGGGYPPGGGGYPPGGGPPGGGGYGPPGGGAPGGYGPPGGAPPGGYGPPGGPPPGGYGPPGGGYAPPGYGPPPGGYGAPHGAYPPPPGGPPGSWSPTEAIGFAWEGIKKDFAGIALPPILAGFVASIPAGIVVGIQQAVIVALAASGDQDVMQIVNMLSGPLMLFISLPVQAFIMGGVLSFSLAVARGRKPELGEVFKGGRYFGAMLGGLFLLFIGYFIGAMFCVVPGVIFALGVGLFGFCVIDQGLGAVDALKRSWEMTKGHKLNLFVLTLLFSLISLLGFLACCIGQLIVVPMCGLALTYVYLKLKGETPVLPA